MSYLRCKVEISKHNVTPSNYSHLLVILLIAKARSRSAVYMSSLRSESRHLRSRHDVSHFLTDPDLLLTYLATSLNHQQRSLPASRVSVIDHSKPHPNIPL